MKKNYGWILLLLVVLIIGFLAGKKCGGLHAPLEKTIVVSDTVILRDTIRIESPPVVKEYTKEIIVEKFVMIHDTIYGDSVAVEIPITTKVYQDSLYRAVVSGYKPSLDSILLFTEQHTINNTIYVPVTEKKKPHWAVGIQLGYGTDFQRFRPYIGVGVQYNILSW